MSVAPIDLSRLPAPEVIETISFETLLAERKAALVSLYPARERAEVAAALELESEPMTILLQENAYREVLLRQRVNEAARAVMLAYARKGNLEQLAALFGIQRLTIADADPATQTEAIYEDDDDLRTRVQLAPDGLSVAGPAGAYRSLARNADGRVLDASATSPAPCEVLVTILSRVDDGRASADLLAAVEAVLLSDERRPLTDKVTVRSAEIVPYTVRARLFTFPGPDSTVVLTQAHARLARFVGETHRLGREVTLSGLYAALHVDGVERVVLDAPSANVAVDRTQAPYCTAAEIEHGGVYG